VVDRKGARLSAISSETPLDDLIISRDGRMLAMSRNSTEGAGYDIWTYDLQRKLFSRVTFTTQCDDPVFSPDGSRIAYSLGGNVVSTRASGVGQPTELYRSGNDDLPVDWSRDGKKILFLSVSDSSSDDVWTYDLQSGKAEPILNTTYSEKHSQFSPDGKWIAYTSNESGQDQIYLIDYPGLTQKIQVSRAGGTAARWRGDGAELYFVTPNDSMAVVSVNTSKPRPTIGEPSSLFATPPMGSRTHRYTVSPDGSTFYLISSLSDEANSALDLVVGWPSLVGPSHAR
jgi:serine/threonine-protein kinase